MTSADIWLIIGCVSVVTGVAWYNSRIKSTPPQWQKVYFFVIDNTEKSDVYLKSTLAFRYGIVGYKAQFLIAAAKKYDQQTFQALYEDLPNKSEPLN